MMYSGEHESSSHFNSETLGHWQTLNRRCVYSGLPWLEVFIERVQLPDGRVVDDYHQVEMGDVVGIIAWSDDERVILERQYRHGIRNVTLVLPGGSIEPGELPLVAAQRELLEETGYKAERWTFLGAFTQSANYRCGKLHLFVARQLSLISAPDGNDLEESKLVWLSEADIVQGIRKGEISSMGAVMGLALTLNVSLSSKD